MTAVKTLRPIDDAVARAVLLLAGIGSIVVLLHVCSHWGESTQSARAQDAVSVYFNQLDGPRAEEAEEALRQLGRQAVAPLFHLVRQDDTLRESVAYVISLLGPQIVPELLAALEDSDECVRSTAVSALILTGAKEPDVVLVLSRRLRDPGWQVRFRVLVALHRAGPARVNALPSLVDLLASLACEDFDEAREMQQQVLQLIAKMRRAAAAAAPQIKPLLNDVSPVIRQEAALALWRITGDCSIALPALSEMSQDSDPEARALAQIAFIRMERDIEATALRTIARSAFCPSRGAGLTSAAGGV